MEYEKLLKRAFKNMPDSVLERERFEIPKVRGHIQGNKTIITNFHQIVDKLRRDPEHVLKFILKELATPGVFRNNALMFGSKISASRINEKIKKYVDTFVICSECGKPDSKLVSEGDLLFLRCQVCGAKKGVKARI